MFLNADNCTLNATPARYLSQISDSIEQVVVVTMATLVRMARLGRGDLGASSWWSDSLENEQPSRHFTVNPPFGAPDLR
jgi:hypothetical protein